MASLRPLRCDRSYGAVGPAPPLELLLLSETSPETPSLALAAKSVVSSLRQREAERKALLLRTASTFVPPRLPTVSVTVPSMTGRVPRAIPLPKAVSWIGISRNVHADDQPVLKYVPYFGDDDVTGLDVSAFDDAVPTVEAEDEVLLVARERLLRTFTAADIDRELGLRRRKEDPPLLEEEAAEEGDVPVSVVPQQQQQQHQRDPSSYASQSESYRELFCRRCYTYDCREHGARQPVPSSRRDPTTAKKDLFLDQFFSSSPLLPVVVQDDVLASKLAEIQASTNGRGAGPLTKKRRLAEKGSRAFFKALCKKKRRSPGGLAAAYVPCEHAGHCTATCPCAATFCDKFCGCDLTCPYRYPGCRCGPGGCRNKMCDCVGLGRECDPDLCRCCEGPCCHNRVLSKRRRKRVAVGRSSVHGWGTYLLEGAKKGEFVAEYKGELVSHDEADRRGKIYDKVGSSFLFNLDEATVVDATRKGCDIKFANHSPDDPNLEPKILKVNGDHRIALLAKRHINPHDELFFNYSDAFWDAANQEKKGTT
eukprot:CAMPEP_0118896222 /NCGR_PEP_ID=MMETSP1166-20130328/4194_1 /TAXON_ID=1104430 /ORGANISM="Chrysoreinhardia sp, Strain CCMP3193" /LENGTH=536 /DNA_ID=CAMNT_0006835275 /DNA_START=72 /DNA_END=1682 /DNA_ORIENTATION=-